MLPELFRRDPERTRCWEAEAVEAGSASDPTL
jgi:hypothetical protein